MQQINIVDDLVLCGTDLEERDLNLRKVLTRLGQQGLTVNGEKCHFRLPRLTFFGHELSARGIAPSEDKIAADLRRWLRKGELFVWGPDQGDAFHKLKQLMTSTKALMYFRNNCKTRIVADTGPEGLGAVLLQLQGDKWRAVSYASRNLYEVERRYAQTEKEELALM